jgi:hypothetical protein
VITLQHHHSPKLGWQSAVLHFSHQKDYSNGEWLKVLTDTILWSPFDCLRYQNCYLSAEVTTVIVDTIRIIQMDAIDLNRVSRISLNLDKDQIISRTIRLGADPRGPLAISKEEGSGGSYLEWSIEDRTEEQVDNRWFKGTKEDAEFSYRLRGCTKSKMSKLSSKCTIIWLICSNFSIFSLPTLGLHSPHSGFSCLQASTCINHCYR